jgi:preprotein translocase subunit SecE
VESPANWIERGRQYATDVWAEFEKIAWPGRREYVGGTVGVLIIVAFMTAVLGVIDFVFGLGFDALIKRLSG